MEAHSDKLKIAVAIIIPNIGNIIQKRYIDGLKIPGGPCWYTGLNKPWYTPPNYVFPPVWLAMYTGMGYASYLVWRDGAGFGGPATNALLLYGLNLVTQWAWSPIFFKHHSMKWSLFDIILSTGTAVATAASFYSINSCAGKILLPYVAWMSFLTLWNYSTYRRNSGGSTNEIKRK